MKNIITNCKKEDGAMAILSAFLVVVLLSFTAFAVDLGLYNLKKSELQTALDAAAIAASYKLPASPNDARATALAYVVKNGFTANDVQVTFQNNNKSVTITSARQTDTYFANLFNIKHLDYNCLAQATMSPRPIMGAAFGFAIYSSSAYPAQPCFSVKSQNVCAMSGLSNVVDGSVHANYNLDANTSTVLDVGEAVGTVIGANIVTKLTGAPIIPMPDFSIYKPQIKADAIAAHQYYSGNFSIANATSVNVTSSIYIEGNANLSGISFSGEGCIYAGGKITVTGSGTNYESTSKICMYSNYTSSNKSDAAIDFSGSAKNFTGMLYAPNGSILVSGSNYTFAGCILGKVVDVSGSNKTFFSVEISESFKYATTSAYVLTQ